MSEHRPNRRGLLKGAAASAAALVAGSALAIEPDPVFAVIAVHAAARKRVNDMDEDDSSWEATLDEEGALWDAFCACRPTTMEGLAAYAAHAAAYPDLWWLVGRDGPAAIIENIAEAFRLLRPQGGAA